MLSSHVGELAALATAFCWTITGLTFESAGRRVGSLAVNWIRLVLAIVLLGFFDLARGRSFLPLDASADAWWWLGLSGVIGFALGDLCLFRAYVLVGSRISMLMMALAPPMAALIGAGFLGERLTGLDWIAMAVTLAGVAWVILERPPAAAPDRPRGSATRGVLLALGGAIGQAVGLVFSKRGMGSYDPFAATQIRVIVGTLGFMVIFFAIRWWPRVGAALRDRPAMARISLGAIFGPFLGVSFSLLAIQHTATGVAATIMALVPVLIIPPAVLLFHERVSLRAVLGSALAVGGVALLFL